MGGLDPFAAREVGDGSGDLEDAVVGAGGEGEAIDRLRQESARRRRELAVLPEVARRHLGVGGDAGASEAIPLDGAGRFDAFADR